MSTVLITGGTGLIGKALANLLIRKRYTVIVLTRDASSRNNKPQNGVKYAEWNTGEGTYDRPSFEEADYIIHLAGAGVADKRWSSRRKKEITESRTRGSALLVKALQETSNHVKAVISASAIGWYGADPAASNARPFNENDPPATDFLGNTCKLWEESISPVTSLGKRLVKIRTGIVLSREGGAFAEFKKPVRFGIAGILGTGKQVISWVHMDDLCRVYLMALENESLTGAYNAVAPKPVTNKEMTLELAKNIRKDFYVPMHVPSFALKFMLGEMSIEVLKSATVSCEKIRKAGFNFIFPSIESAINDLLKRPLANQTKAERLTHVK